MFGDDFIRIAELITNHPTVWGLKSFFTLKTTVKVGGRRGLTSSLERNFGLTGLFLDLRFL
jgi:hypothetical protein